MPLGEPAPQVERRPVRVEMHAAERRRHRGHGARRRPEGILVRRQLDRALDAELALDFLDGLAGRIRRERADPLRHEGTDVDPHQGSGAGAAGYDPRTLNRAAPRPTPPPPRRPPPSRLTRPRPPRLAPMPLQVEEEVVPPRPLAQRAGLDLDQVDAMAGERPQHAGQYPPLVAHAHDERRLVVPGQLLAVLAAEHEEAGGVLGLVLDATGEHVEP